MESLIRKTMPWYTIQRPAGPLQILLQRRDSGAFWVANAIRIPEEKGKAEEELRGWGTEKSPNFVGVQSGAVWGERGEGGGVVIVTKHQVFDGNLDWNIHRGVDISVDVCLKLLYDIAVCLDQLHAEGRAHRNVNLRTIFIDSKTFPDGPVFRCGGYDENRLLAAIRGVEGVKKENFAFVDPRLFRGGDSEKTLTPSDETARSAESDLFALGIVAATAFVGEKPTKKAETCVAVGDLRAYWADASRGERDLRDVCDRLAAIIPETGQERGRFEALQRIIRELLSVNSESGERAGLTARRVMMELKGLVSHGNAQVDQGTVTVVRNAGDIASLARGETSFETVLEELAVLREGGVENEEGGRRVQELESAAIFADPVQEKGGAVWGLRGGEMDLSSLEESKRLWEGLSCRANVPPTPKETSEGDEEEREETEEDPLTWWEWLGSCCSCVSRDVPEQ